MDNDLCCDATNEGPCQDNTIIESGTEVGVAWYMNEFVVHCSETYKNTH